jgi:hypothetical protein
MRIWIMGAVGLSLLALSVTAGVNPAVAATVAAQAPIVMAQADTKKPETTTQKVKREVKEEASEVKKKVKRAWKNVTGYKFAVACPALIPINHSTCTETGSSRADARAKCQGQSPLCSVTEAK